MTARIIDALPLIAILRGVHPLEVVEVGRILVESGITSIEVPLNSPQPLQSIERLAVALGSRCIIGAGTVLSPESVSEIVGVGGTLIVMPHADERVIAAAKRAGLLCVPGAATPSEAFRALDAGADAIKVFPAEQITPAALKAWRSVLPARTALIPVGGIDSETMRWYIEIGVAGFGIGSSLYAPGRALESIRAAAIALVRTWSVESGRAELG